VPHDGTWRVSCCHAASESTPILTSPLRVYSLYTVSLPVAAVSRLYVVPHRFSYPTESIGHPILLIGVDNLYLSIQTITFVRARPYGAFQELIRKDNVAEL
jgi:hypothetical protein